MVSVNKQIDQNLSELSKWSTDSFNESFMFQTPWTKLQQFLSTPDLNPGGIAGDLTSLSMWFAAIGATSKDENKSREHLTNSLWCDYSYNLMMRLSFEKEQQEKPSLWSSVLGEQTVARARICFNDQGLLLAKSFALGFSTDGERIGYQSLAGLRDSRYYGISVNKLTPFVMKVFSIWKNVELSSEEFPFEIPEAYHLILDNLTLGPNDIREAIVAACDFHLSRAKEDTDDETYEFSSSVYAIYPVEILFVFRIRQLLGLTNPEVDHPLLRNPLGKLADAKSPIDPLLLSVSERIEKYFLI